MREEWKDFLSFTKAERRGIFVLSTLILLLIIYQVWGPVFFSKSYDFSKFKNQVAAYKHQSDSLEKIRMQRSNQNQYPEETEIKVGQNFDPNTLTKQQWLAMGLRSWQVKSILKYVKKGGRFYEAEDLRKMYCLSQEECDLLIPHVQIKSPEEDLLLLEDKDIMALIEKDSVTTMEINSATIENLQQVYGIGPSIAKGIVKYRALLGGYYSLNQLREVYFIDSLKYDLIADRFRINTDSIHCFSLNQVTYNELSKHPYISKSTAYEIVQFRNQKGNYKQVGDLQKIKGINDSLYQRIKPYFEIIEQQ